MRFVGESALICAKNEWNDSDYRSLPYPPTPSNHRNFTSHDRIAWDSMRAERQERLLDYALELEGRCASREQPVQPVGNPALEGGYLQVVRDAVKEVSDEERQEIIRQYERTRELERAEFELNAAAKIAQWTLRNNQ